MRALDDLYALPVEEFVAARIALAKELKAAGRTTEATEVAAARKPTQSAWLANQVVRRHADLLGDLKDLGGRLREAQTTLLGGGRADMAGLAKDRQALVRKVISAATGLAGRLLPPSVRDDLEATVTAALADELALKRLAEARLTAPLEPPAFGGLLGVEGGPPVVVPRKAASSRPAPSTASPRTARSASGPGSREAEPSAAKAEAERAAEAARLEGERARAAAERAAAKDAVGAAERALREATAAAAALDKEHVAVQREQLAVERKATQVAARKAKADAAAAAAERRLSEARARLHAATRSPG